MIIYNRFLLFLIITTFASKLCGEEPPIILDGITFPKNDSGPVIKNSSQKRLQTRLPQLSMQQQLAQLEMVRHNKLINNQRSCNSWLVDDFEKSATITGKISDKEWLFDQWELYRFPTYWSFLKTFDGHEDRLLSAYDKISKDHNYPGNWHNTGLCHLNCIASECSDIRAKRDREEAFRKARQKYEDNIKSGYQECADELDENIDDYYTQLDFYDAHDMHSDRLERRMQALFADEASPSFGYKKHPLADHVKQELWRHQVPAYEYESCYGSQLQQTIHQECVDIVDRAIGLTSDHPAYPYKDAIIDMADGARQLNKMGKTEKAMSVADVCWGILDCCSAVVEGAIEGAVGAVTDIYNNPLQTVASLTVGNYLMAYQVLKVATNLADIGITSLIDAQAGREKWDDYIQPITNVITAISSAELSLATIRTTLKEGTRLLVQNRVQGKILGGLGKFYSNVKTKAINYIDKNPLSSPQMYMTTPEGVMFKAVDESFCTAQQAAQSGQFAAGSATQSTPSVWTPPKQLREAARAVEKKMRESGRPSIRSLIKEAELPLKGKIRYVPPKKFDIANGLPHKVTERGRAYIDRFDNVWKRGNPRTKGQNHEWDVQLSDRGVKQLGWMTRDNTHLNVSLDGRVTHK